MKNFLIEITPLNPATSSYVTIRMTRADADKESVVLNDQVWTACLTGTPTMRLNAIFSNGAPQPAEFDYGTLAFLIGPDYANTAWSTYSFDGALIKIWMGDMGSPWASYSQIHEGFTGPLARDGQTANVVLKGNEAALEKDFLSATYGGAGGADGSSDLKGVLKPRAYGSCANIQPLCIDWTNQVYQFHDGAAGGISKVYENALEIAPSPAVTVSTYAALIAADLDEGEWAAAPAIGMFRLGAEPSGKLTADVTGPTAAGTTIGTIVPEMMKLSGIAVGKIDTTSIGAFTETWSLYQTEQISIGDAVRTAFTGLGFIFPSNTGVFKATRFWSNATPTALKADRSAYPLVNSVKQLASSPPNHTVRVGGNRCWSVHSDSEISEALRIASQQAITASLSNQSHTVAASNTGVVSSFAGAGGIMRVYEGIAEVTGFAAYSVVSETGVDVSIDAAGLYTVNSMSADTGTAVFRASYKGENRDLTYTISKAKAGADGSPAVLVKLLGTHQTFRYDTNGNAVAQTATFTVDKKNTTATVNWRLYKAEAPSTVLVSGTTATMAATAFFSAGTGDSLTQSQSQFNTYTMNNASNGYILEAYVVDGSTTYADKMSVVKLADGLAGATGPSGYNTKTVHLYRRSVTTPTLPSTTATYTFDTDVLTGHNNSWTQTIPAGTDALWVTTASAVSTGPTDTISGAEWAAPVVLAQNGQNGTAGLNSATVYLYRRSATTPALPSGTVTYTFATAVASGLTNSWTQTIPAGTDPIYVTTATASSTGATDTIATGEWAATTVLAQNGANGAAGLNSATVYAYQRAVSAPTLPSATTTYTFASGALTGLNNGWTTTVPAGSNPLYVTVATASSNGATDTIASNEWSAAVILAQDGSTGSAGLNSATVYLYQRATSTPALPSTSITYTFADGTSTAANNGWTRTIPTGSNPLYVTHATAASNTATDVITSGEWAAATILVQDGLASVSVTLTSTSNVFNYDSAGAVKSGQKLTFTAVAQNSTAEVRYSIRKSDGSPVYSSGTPLTGKTELELYSTAYFANETGAEVFSQTGSQFALLCLENGITEYSITAYLVGVSSAYSTLGVTKVQDGATGATGANSAPVFIYRRAATSPTKPSATTTYTFASGALTGLNNSWSTSWPAADGTTNPVWWSTATASSNTATDTIAAAEWSTPVKMLGGLGGLDTLDWNGGLIANRDTWLTDGRVSAGLNANGDIARNLPANIKSNITADDISDGVIHTRYQTFERAKLSGIASGATNDSIVDTRNDNQPPTWYRTNYPYRVAREFKYANAIGLTGAVFGTLVTTVAWNNTSGGLVKQSFTFGAGTQKGATYKRVGTSDDSGWEAWKKDYSEDLKPSWDSDVDGRPANLAGLTGSEWINNENVTLQGNGTGVIRLNRGPSAVDYNLSSSGIAAMAYKAVVKPNDLAVKATGANLVGDPTFTDSDYWVTFTQGFSGVAWNFHDKTSHPTVATNIAAPNFIKFSGTGATASGAKYPRVTMQQIPLVAGQKTYFFSVDYYCETAHNGSDPMIFYPLPLDVNGNIINYASVVVHGPTLAAGAKATVTGTVTLPANAVSMQPRMQRTVADGTSVIGGVFYSNFRLEPVLDVANSGLLINKSLASLDAAANTNLTTAHNLTLGGSGQTLGSQRNVPPINSMNAGYKFTGAVSYNATAGSPASATISVTAGNALIGSNSISYNAMSANVTGTGGTSATYALYIQESANSTTWGGSKTLLTTTNSTTIFNNDLNVWIGSVTVAFPSSGSGSGSGGSGGGTIPLPPDDCVCAESWMADGRLAKEYEAGDTIRVLDEETWEGATETHVVANKLVDGVDCVKLTSKSGITVVLSKTTPLTLRGGSVVYFDEIEGKELAVEDADGFRWEAITSVEEAGLRTVAHISANDATYAAGEEKGRFIYTHNRQYKA